MVLLVREVFRTAYLPTLTLTVSVSLMTVWPPPCRWRTDDWWERSPSSFQLTPSSCGHVRTRNTTIQFDQLENIVVVLRILGIIFLMKWREIHIGKLSRTDVTWGWTCQVDQDHKFPVLRPSPEVFRRLSSSLPKVSPEVSCSSSRSSSRTRMTSRKTRKTSSPESNKHKNSTFSTNTLTVILYSRLSSIVVVYSDDFITEE
jgi:hypothetical protein